MIALKGAEVSAKLKEQVAALKKGVKGETPCLAIVRVGENPDDMSYERGAMKKMEAFGLKAQSFAFPADITDGDFKREFARINGDPAVDGILPVSYTHLDVYKRQGGYGAHDGRLAGALRLRGHAGGAEMRGAV